MEVTRGHVFDRKDEDGNSICGRCGDMWLVDMVMPARRCPYAPVR